MPITGFQGVLIDGLFSVEFAINNLALPTTSVDTTGAIVSSFSSTQAIQSNIEKDIVKTGTRIDFYDPEVAALLAGEL